MSEEYSITLKAPKKKEVIKVLPKCTIKEVREKACAAFESTPDRVVLIFAGKILKDADTVETHNIKDKHTVHVVIKTKPSTSAPPSNSQPAAQQPAAQPASTPNNPANNTNNLFAGLGGLGNLGNMFGGQQGGLGGDRMRQMQEQMMNNPQMMEQMMNSPMMQNMMNNPELLQNMMMNNPQMQQLMDRNPEIRHALNDPNLLRQTMELARNPAAMQEHLRNQDRMMSNLESLPGGSAALQRAFTDIQSPMMESFARNPFASLANNSSNEPTETPTTENTEPLPNPWGGGASQGGSNNSAGNNNRNTTTTTQGANNPTNNMFGADMAGMFNTPGMQDMMNSLTSNPDMMANMMNSPYVRQMMQQMANNPDQLQQMLGNNPLFASNPQMQQMMPQMMQNMLNNPQMMQQMGNPRTQQALRQIQEGMSALQQEAPGLFPGAAGAAAGGNQGAAPTTGTNNQSGQGGLLNNPDLLNMMANLMGGGAGNNQQPPEERYRQQLEQLVQMGFNNREANLRALAASNGNINGAVEFLLTNR